MLMKIEDCLIRGQDSRNSLYWKRRLQKDTCGRGGDCQKFKQLLDQIIFGQKLGQKLWNPSEKKGMGNRDAKTRECQKFERYSLHWSEWRRIQPYYQEYEKEIGDTHGGSNAVQKIWKLKGNQSSEYEKSQSIWENSKRWNSIVLWKLMNPKDPEWNRWRRKIMKTIKLAKDRIQFRFITGAQMYSYATRDENSRREWKKLETFPAWQLEKITSQKVVIIEARK